VAALVRHPLIDEILDARREYARGERAAFEGYRNHAHRVYNFARSISSLSPQDEDKVAIAAAFHDLCVFDGLDYLEPSIEEAARYLRQTGREAWDREVALMIAFHHRVRPYRAEHARLVEPFRRADWNDFTMGLVRAASHGTCARPPRPNFRSPISSRRQSSDWRWDGCRAIPSARHRFSGVVQPCGAPAAARRGAERRWADAGVGADLRRSATDSPGSGPGAHGREARGFRRQCGCGPDGPHNIGWTFPDEVNAALLDFLAGGTAAVDERRRAVALRWRAEVVDTRTYAPDDALAVRLVTAPGWFAPAPGAGIGAGRRSIPSRSSMRMPIRTAARPRDPGRAFRPALRRGCRGGCGDRRRAAGRGGLAGGWGAVRVRAQAGISRPRGR
jgi:hypothetical protein